MTTYTPSYLINLIAVKLKSFDVVHDVARYARAASSAVTERNGLDRKNTMTQEVEPPIKKGLGDLRIEIPPSAVPGYLETCGNNNDQHRKKSARSCSFHETMTTKTQAAPSHRLASFSQKGKGSRSPRGRLYPKKWNVFNSESKKEKADRSTVSPLRRLSSNNSSSPSNRRRNSEYGDYLGISQIIQSVSSRWGARSNENTDPVLTIMVCRVAAADGESVS